MAYCDFCTCEDCQYGRDGIKHAPTKDGGWICDVCFMYDLCIAGSRKGNRSKGPCENEDCVHRPRLSGEWRT